MNVGDKIVVASSEDFFDNMKANKFESVRFMEITITEIRNDVPGDLGPERRYVGYKGKCVIPDTTLEYEIGCQWDRYDEVSMDALSNWNLIPKDEEHPTKFEVANYLWWDVNRSAHSWAGDRIRLAIYLNSKFEGHKFQVCDHSEPTKHPNFHTSEGCYMCNHIGTLPRDLVAQRLELAKKLAGEIARMYESCDGHDTKLVGKVRTDYVNKIKELNLLVGELEAERMIDNA